MLFILISSKVIIHLLQLPHPINLSLLTLTLVGRLELGIAAIWVFYGCSSYELCKFWEHLHLGLNVRWMLVIYCMDKAAIFMRELIFWR